MAGLYEQLLSPLVQGKVAIATDDAGARAPKICDSAVADYTAETSATQSERLTLEQRIELAEAIASQQKQVERIKTRLGREKQFNKRVAINAELRDAKQQLQRLIQQQADTQNQ